MEEELSPTRSSSSAPSDPLDALIEQMEAARSAAQENGETAQDNELDVEEDETTGTDTTASGEPNDDDIEDEDDTDEVKTPADAEEDDDDELPEPKQTKPTDKTSKTEDKKDQSQGTDSDDDKPLSRKQRGKLIEELRQQLAAEQEQNRLLEDRQRTQREEDERLNKEVDRALGTQEEFDKALEDGLNGDETASKRYQIWKQNREFYKKLVTRSDRQAREEFVGSYWSQVQGLPGITEEALRGSSLADVLKNVYDAGVSSVKNASTDEIEKLKSDVETWRGRYRALKAKAGGAKQSPLGGGGSTTSEQPFDWRKKYIRNGELTDEAEEIVSRYGFEALQNPKLIKER